MATLDEFKESMTVFFSKSTGVIRTIATGVQSMSIYGDMQEDMKLIQDCIVIPMCKDIFDNKDKYKVNLDTKEVVKVLTTQEEEKFKSLSLENANLKQSVAELTVLVTSLVGGGV